MAREDPVRVALEVIQAERRAVREPVAPSTRTKVIPAALVPGLKAGGISVGLILVAGSVAGQAAQGVAGEKDAFSRDDFAKRTSFLVTRTVASQGGIHGGQGADKENKARTELSQELWRNPCCAGAGDASANGAKWKEELRHGP